MRRPAVEPNHDAVDLLLRRSGIGTEAQDIRKTQTQNRRHPKLDEIPAWHARAIRDQSPHVFLDELSRTGLQLQILRSPARKGLRWGERTRAPLGRGITAREY